MTLDPRRSSRSLALGLLAASPLLLAAGCSAPDRSPGYGRGGPADLVYVDPVIEVLAPDLRDILEFQPAIIVDDGRRPMEVQVPVRNVYDEKYLVDYRIVFYDEYDRELQPTMGWAFVPFEAKQSQRMSAKALSTEAVRYKLQVRWAR